MNCGVQVELFMHKNISANLGVDIKKEVVWKQQLYGHQPPITKTVQIRQTRHAEHCWISKNELISDVLLWTPLHKRKKVGRPVITYLKELCIDDTGWKICRERWTIEMNGEKGSGKSVLTARHDDEVLKQIGKVRIQHSGLFNLLMATDQGEGKLWIQKKWVFFYFVELLWKLALFLQRDSCWMWIWIIINEYKEFSSKIFVHTLQLLRV